MNGITINPALTNNFPNTFSIQSDGLIQGTAFADPATRYALRSGVLDVAEALPMWGGVAITENVPNAATISLGLRGGKVQRATSIASTKPVTGFSVFDQAYNWLTSPQSPVPLATGGMDVNLYALGSGARIAVKADPGLVSLDGLPINQQVSWDFNLQQLVPYDASTPTVSVTSMTDSYANGLHTISIVCAAPSNVQAVGDGINISGATNTGTGGNAVVNGNFVVTQFTDNENFKIQIPGVAGLIGTIAGTILLNQGTGALPCKILLLQPSNCKTVTYDPVTGFATFNDNGSCAVIQI